MQVNKLIITPILKGCKGFTTYNPDNSMAFKLIRERMEHEDVSYKCLPNRVRQLPKNLRGWVNPKTRIVVNRRFM